MAWPGPEFGEGLLAHCEDFGEGDCQGTDIWGSAGGLNGRKSCTRGCAPCAGVRASPGAVSTSSGELDL